MSEQERKPKVWKIGSRWGNKSILDLFYKSNIVFVGNAKGRLEKNVKRNDFITIAKGKKIVAVAKAAEDGKKLTEKDIDPKKIEYLNDSHFYSHTEGVRCYILVLDDVDCFPYAAIKSFCEATEISSKIINIFHSYNKGTKNPTDYDQSFKDLINQKKLTWYPWIGQNYQNSNRKILLIGDSHYMHPNPTYLSIDYTRMVIREWGFEKPNKQPFNRNLRYALIGKTTNKQIISNFWQTVAFYNFVQRPMKNSSTPPSDKDFSDGWETFRNVVDILKPTDIIFFGLRASDHSDQKYISVWRENKKINNSQAKILKIEDNNYSNIKIIAIKHPSSFFSWKKWNEYINDINPELISFLKHESFDNLSI